MHLFKTKPVVTQYVKALYDDERVLVQDCDRNGKPRGKVREMPANEFASRYEPARKERTTPAK